MSHAYIIAAARTPIGKLCGSLASLSAPQLAAHALRACLERAGVSPDVIDEVILGQVLTAGAGQAPARQAALGAGLPPTVAALTVNKVCGSGLKAVMLADQAIRAGDARCVLAGGMESMSRAPHLSLNLRQGRRYGDETLVDSMIHDGLRCAIENWPMGAAADFIANEHGVTRAAQDAFALESHRRAAAAMSAHQFDAEVVSVTLKSKSGETVVTLDEGPRRDASLEGLAKLKPAFDPAGTVTAGNASQISDGAAALLVVSEDLAHRVNSPIKARILATATHGVAPKELFFAPVGAIEKVLRKAGVTIADVDLIELNEAFAAQCLACMNALQLPLEKTNAYGGAIALGHPIGASGARVLVTLLHALAAQDKAIGLASICLGGGEAVAMIVERM
ncbi:MAG: thiolase family protein [Planctomycetia bacterium]|nr:thiolase family protein [Planctomycetia bacterium]